MIPILIEAGQIMNVLFLYEDYGDNVDASKKTKSADLQKLIGINYGPWDRLDGNTSFVDGVGTNQPVPTIIPLI